VHMTTVKPDTEDVGKVAWDGENLFVGIWMAEPFMEHQTLNKATSSSGICLDDSIEVFVDVGRKEPAGRAYLQVMMTANGVLWRYYWGKHKVFAADMPELGVRGAAWRGPDQWTAELVIPLKVLVDMTEDVDFPKPGDTWGLNLYRNRRHRKFKTSEKDRYAKGATGWSVTFDGFHVARRFGVLEFGD